MDYPLITIITPSFNQGQFLEETICSVLDQGYPNLQYIIIDGGSTDNSVSIIKKYAARLSYWVSEKDNGQSEAINKGLKLAKGDIISWLCSDDVYTPGALNKIVTLFKQNNNPALIHGKTILFGEGKKDIIRGADYDQLDLKYFAIIPFPQPSSFFHRRVIERYGMLDENLHFAMDFDLLERVALNDRIVCSEEIFSKYRIHRDSKTGSKMQVFQSEWGKVFCRFLYSIGNADEELNIMKQTSFYFEPSTRYPLTRTFTKNEVHNILLFHLEIQMHISYQLANKIASLKILNIIRELDPPFYASRNMAQLRTRIRFIPISVLKWIRKFKNSFNS